MTREQGNKGRGLACIALAVLALAGMLSYAQDKTPTPPPQIPSTTKIDVIGSAKPGDGSDTDKAWTRFWHGLFPRRPIEHPVLPPLPPLPVPDGILGQI